MDALLIYKNKATRWESLKGYVPILEEIHSSNLQPTIKEEEGYTPYHHHCAHTKSFRGYRLSGDFVVYVEI